MRNDAQWQQTFTQCLPGLDLVTFDWSGLGEITQNYPSKHAHPSNMWSRYCNPTPRIALFVCLCLRLLPHLLDAHRHPSYVWASALDSPKKSSLCIFGNGMKDNHFLMSWWEDGSYLNILWVRRWEHCHGDPYYLSEIQCYNIHISSFLSDSVSSLQRKQSFLAMLELLSTVRWGLSSMNICKLDIFFLKTAVSQSNWLASSWYEPGGNLGNSHLVLTICYISINTFWFLYLRTLWSVNS